jgi:beta-galactosidase
MRFLSILIMAPVLLCCSNPDTDNTTIRGITKFDFGWKFLKADPEGAYATGFDDRSWRTIDLPHDWSIEDLDPASLPDSGIWEGPFYSFAPGGRSTGFTMGGTAWYRKHFRMPRDLHNRCIYLLFEGVYMNADVWINGTHLGNHPYGYTSFWYDITEHLNPGAENIIAVQVKNEGLNSRWYSGSWIYRHVWLFAVEPVHIVPWGIAVSTSSLTDQGGIVKVSCRLVNKGTGAVKTTVINRILEPEGREIQEESEIQEGKEIRGEKEISPAGESIEVGAGQERVTDTYITIPHPELWSPGHPYLYTLETEVYADGKLSDRLNTPFGIRTVEFTVEQGCLLNGEPILLKGGCMHHDNGPLGARAYYRAEERRVEIMKASGFNAIRTAHNPPSPAFLDACDRLGLLVIDEAFDQWQVEKNPQDYHLYFYDWWKRDLESMVFRDRNHPSVILWSTGNEIMGKHLEETIEWSAKLADYIRTLDPTRAVTNAVQVWRQENWDSLARFMAPLDVVGYNYHPEKYIPDHEKHPSRIIFCSESNPSRAFEFWMPVLDLPWVFGDFVWTSYDYLGEASIGWHTFYKSDLYPWTHAYCGDVDLLGNKRPQSFYRDVLWQEGNRVFIFVHNPVPSFAEPGGTRWWGWDDVYPAWTWTGYEGQTMKVDVYSSCEQAELFLNGESRGKKPTGRNTEFRASWDVACKPGELLAKGYIGNEVVAENVLITAGEPSAIRLTADRQEIRADRQDLCYITVEVTDGQGNRHPFARNLISFSVGGPGEIVAVGSADPMSTESFQKPERRTYLGVCQVILKAGDRPGTIVLKALGEGLKPAEISIKTKEISDQTNGHSVRTKQ